MRTIVDLPDNQIEALAELGREQALSRAELIRRAVAEFLRVHHCDDGDADAFGLWKHRPVNALDHEDALRREWSE